MIIDASDAVLGRLASEAAKELKKGEEVIIVNAEKAVISGSNKMIQKNYDMKRARGGNAKKGPYISRMPDRLVRRTIRGMLPMDKSTGREMFKKLKVYIGVPADVKEKPIVIEAITTKKRLKDAKYVTILELSRHLGAKV